MLFKHQEEIQPLGWVLNLTRQILWSVDHYTESIYKRLEHPNHPGNSQLYLAQIAIGLSPDPLGIAHVLHRRPYSNPEYIRKDLDAAVSRGWLSHLGNGLYQPTSLSLEIYHRLCLQLEGVYLGLESMPLIQLEQTQALLRVIIEAVEDSGSLWYKPSFELDLKMGRRTGPVLQRICTCLSHLMAYRDDAYLNAWMGQEVNSYVWEAFSCIYKGHAQTAKEITTILGDCRHYDLDTYESALEELRERGWITSIGKMNVPTDDGIKVLAQVARTLNSYFYKPWQVFNDVETNQLKSLMETLASALKVGKPKYGSGYASLNRTIGWGSVQWVRDKIR